MLDRSERLLRVFPVLCAIFGASGARAILAEDAPGAQPPGMVEHVTETTPASVTALAPDYLTWSAGIGYVVRDVEIRLDGTNLNNQRPPVAESELGDAQHDLMPARSLALSARWTPGSQGR